MLKKSRVSNMVQIMIVALFVCFSAKDAKANKAIFVIGNHYRYHDWPDVMSKRLYQAYNAFHRKMGYSREDIIVVYANHESRFGPWEHPPIGENYEQLKSIIINGTEIPLDYPLTEEGVVEGFKKLRNLVQEGEKVFVGIGLHGHRAGYNGSERDEFLLDLKKITMAKVAGLIEEVAKKTGDVFVYNNSCFGGYFVDKLKILNRDNGSLGNLVAMSSSNDDLCVEDCTEQFEKVAIEIGSNTKITPAKLYQLYGFEMNEDQPEDESRYWEGTTGHGDEFNLDNPTGDADGDGVENENDNCIVDCNPRQLDCNEDGIGDECDDDQTPCVMLTSLSTRVVRTKYENGNFKMYENATPEFIDLSYKTMGEGVHDVQMRWCDCSPWEDDSQCRKRNCDMINFDKRYSLHFGHSQWHMMSLAKRQEDINETIIPVKTIGTKRVHQLRVNCPMETSWSKEGVDPWTGIVTKHCSPEKQDYGQEYEYGRIWDWTNEIWWQTNRTTFERQDPDREYRGYIWVRPEKTEGVKENEAFTNKFVRFNMKKPGWSYNAPSQEPIFVDERSWVMYDPIEDVIDPVSEPIIDENVKPLNPVVSQPVVTSPLFR